MASLFVFSDAFTTRTILFKLDYLLNIKIDKIILLKENHNSEDNFMFNETIEVRLCKEIDTCIISCDFILVLKDENIPQKSIDYVLKKSRERNKESFVIENPWGSKDNNCNIYQCDYKSCSFNEHPVILNISIGDTAQQYCTEILLNKVFVENKIIVRQFYSQKTKAFLLQLKAYGILNDEISKQLSEEIGGYDIIICAINVGDDLYDIQRHMDFFKVIKSDYIILQTNIKFNEYEIAKNIIKYTCFSQLDLLIKSHYSLIDGMLTPYCNEDIKETDLIQDLESVKLEDKLIFKIFSKIAYPEGIIGL